MAGLGQVGQDRRRRRIASCLAQDHEERQNWAIHEEGAPEPSESLVGGLAGVAVKAVGDRFVSIEEVLVDRGRGRRQSWPLLERNSISTARRANRRRG